MIVHCIIQTVWCGTWCIIFSNIYTILQSNMLHISLTVTCANLRRSLTTDTLVSWRRCKACSHSSIQRSNRALSANTAPRKITGWGTSGLWLPKIRSRIDNDSMCRAFWLNLIASNSSNVWHSTQFSYAGTGFTSVFSITLCGSLYLKFRTQI